MKHVTSDEIGSCTSQTLPRVDLKGTRMAPSQGNLGTW
jgi:hypothetical protein